jgi:hypothetical protein
MRQLVFEKKYCIFYKNINKNLYYRLIKVKVKVPRNGLESPEGGKGIVLLFLDFGARRGWVVSTTPRPLYPRK